MRGALEAFVQRAASSLGSAPVVIIEGGYFDRREAVEKGREHQLKDSFELLARLREVAVPVRPTFLLSALANDFADSGAICGFERCDALLPEGPLGESSEALPHWARSIYQQHCPDAAQCGFRAFRMRATRNRATTHLKRLLKQSNAAVREQPNTDVVDLYAETPAGAFYLGYREPSSRRITIRCTALMAQHYFDLSQFAHDGRRSVSDLWIFDFNHYLERDRVRAGAEVSLALFPWPAAQRVTIVNCVYFPIGENENSVEITTGPT